MSDVHFAPDRVKIRLYRGNHSHKPVIRAEHYDGFGVYLVYGHARLKASALEHAQNSICFSVPEYVPTA